jgi:hypothetical protein
MPCSRTIVELDLKRVTLTSKATLLRSRRDTKILWMPSFLVRLQRSCMTWWIQIFSGKDTTNWTCKILQQVDYWVQTTPFYQRWGRNLGLGSILRLVCRECSDASAFWQLVAGWLRNKMWTCDIQSFVWKHHKVPNIERALFKKEIGVWPWSGAGRNAPATLTRKTIPKLLPTKLAGKGGTKRGTKRNTRRVKISNCFIFGQLQ